jgi:exonuclease III
MNDRAGSFIYVKKEIRTKELNDLEYFGEVKNFELSITELGDYKIILICIYRSPNGKFEVFLNRLEIVIQKLQNTKKRLILSGDWNINFLHDSPQVTEINNLLTRFNLIITVKVPMNITKTSSSLLDVIIIKNEKIIRNN